MAVIYEVLPPAPLLAPYVECYWSLQGDAADLGATPERVLPDGRVEIVFNLADPMRQSVAAETRLQPMAIVVGPTTRTVAIQPTARVHAFGVRFRHGGAHRVLATPLVLLTDRIVALGDLGHLFPASFREQLHDAGDARAQARIVDDRLTRLTTRGRARRGSAGEVTARAARMILAADGAPGVDEVAAAVGVSGRQLARRFRDEVGVGPKLLARLARFHAALRIVAADRPATLAAAAARAGYVDQSHLRRDFKEFADETPSGFFRERHELSALFFALDALGA